MEAKNIIQLLEEECQEIVKDLSSAGQLEFLRVEKAEMSLEVRAIINEGKLNKDELKKFLTDKLKSKLAVPVKVKVKLI